MKSHQNINLASTIIFGAALLLTTLLHQPSAIAQEATVTKGQNSFKSAVTAYRNNNYARAYSLFNLLAEVGHAKAQSNLGLLFLRGYGVDQDTEAALEWFEKSAEQGIVAAQFNLGYLYSTLKGINRDLPKAIHWYTKAAKQGHPTACYRLAKHFKQGVGVEADHVEALRWATLGIKVVRAKKLKSRIVKFRDDLLKKMTREQILEATGTSKV